MTTRQILDRFPTLSALVVGDICLDRWCTYDPKASELSRETGIPRIAVVATDATPGAAGTVASNLAALGVGRVSVLGVTGDDGFGFELRNALRRHQIDESLVLEVAGLQTFTYTKFLNAMSGKEDLPRVDFINVRPAPPEVEDAICSTLDEVFGDFDVILVSDQAESATSGAVTPGVRDRLGELAREYPSKIVWVDSRLRAELFRNVIVKPNEREASEACQRLGLLEVDYMSLRRTIGSRPLVITRGGQGAEIWDEAGMCFVPARNIDRPVDICGAGDSFSAGAAMTMAATGLTAEAARIGNLVAAVTIMKKGTGTASPQEVLEAERGG